MAEEVKKKTARKKRQKRRKDTKEAYSRRGGPKPKITDQLEMVLFKLWMAGKTLTELSEMYRDTEFAFSVTALSLAKRKYDWDGRREKLLQRIREKNEEEIDIFNSEKLNILHLIITLSKQTIEREYRRYCKNPQDPNNRPSWLPTTIKDLDILFRAHEFIASGGVNKIAGGSLKDLTGDELPDSAAQQLLSLLSEAATKQLAKQTGDVIDAEFNEMIEEEVKDLVPIEDNNGPKKG